MTALLLAALLAQGYEEKPLTETDRSHWAFRPPSRPATGSSIDSFIDARLEKAGVAALPEADRATLLRRITFDLTGLPPTPQEVEAFAADGSPRAYEDAVDRLLASPAYGERWAQHWLDLVRFAETDGFEHDKYRPDAWRFRDWVIRALNDDLPYDRFLALQLAADELEPGNADAALATGFLFAGPDMADLNAQDERRNNVLNDMTAAVGSAFMGLTLGCAQCHDHKSDPIRQADFFRIRAAFANLVWPKRDKPLGSVAAEPSAQAPPEPLLLRGELKRPGPVIEPGFIRVANPSGLPYRAEPLEKSTGRRRALAQWLSRPDHPLTGRVIVNWLWTHHFGRGIVATPGDFGTGGSRPSHPELLDWLATELPARGWSLKAMHRLMVLSAAYRRASRPGPSDGSAWARGREADPENALHWRMNRRRLEGEAIRDAALAVADRLSRRKGGPGVKVPLPPEVITTLRNKAPWEVAPDAEDHRRRSIYLHASRVLRFPMFEVFDRPAPECSCPQRSRSTTATQALTLLNSALLREAAAQLSSRAASEAGADGDSRIRRVVLLALARPATPRDVERGVRFLSAQGDAALADFCLALLNSNEFVYID